MNIHEQPLVSFGLFPLKATEANDKGDERRQKLHSNKKGRQ